MQEMRDPSLTVLGVFTESPGTVRTKLFVDARTRDSSCSTRGRPSSAAAGVPATSRSTRSPASVAAIDDPSSAMTGLFGMTHTVAPPALDRESRAPELAPVTSSTATVPPADDRDEPLGLDLAATLGMIAYAIAVAIGFSKVFVGWDFLRDLVLIAVVGHGVSYVTRRLRLPPLVAIPLVLVVLTWLVAWIYYPDTFTGVFPLADTWETVRADFRVVRDDFQSTTPPVEYAGGWAFLAGATMAATVWLADTFAFRAQARGEALVPGAVLFVFVAALGVDERRIVSSLAVVGAGFCALALLRQRLERRPRTVLGRSLHPLLTTVPAIACAGAVVLAGAWALGPNLPGADAEPLFDTHNDRGGVTEIVSPLVDIRSRLVNQAENELFTVAADLPSYWRAAALPGVRRRTVVAARDDPRRGRRIGQRSRRGFGRQPATDHDPRARGRARPGRCRAGTGRRSGARVQLVDPDAREDDVGARRRRRLRRHLGDAAIHGRATARCQSTTRRRIPSSSSSPTTFPPSSPAPPRR